MARDADDPELRALLDQIGDLRLRLSADLGAAAGAVDADAPGVARDVLAGAQDDVAAFALRADRHLVRAGGSTEAVGPAAEPVAPVVPLRTRGARRLVLAGPALTAAAALVAVLVGVVPSTGPAGVPQPVATSAASSYAELLRLDRLGASGPRVQAAARDLHDELARLIALAPEDPATAEQALRLLEREAQRLQSADADGSLRPALAEAERLLGRLRAAVLAAGGTLLAGPPVGPLLPASAAPLPLRTGRPSAAASPAGEPPRPGLRAADPALPPLPALPLPLPLPLPVPAPQPEPAPQPAAPPPAEQPPAEPTASPSPSASATSAPDPSDPRTWFPDADRRSILPG